MTTNQLIASLQHVIARYPETGEQPVFVDVQLSSRIWKERQLGISSSIRTKEGATVVCLACPIYSPPDEE